MSNEAGMKYLVACWKVIVGHLWADKWTNKWNFSYRIECKRVWNCSTRFATTNGSRTRPSSSSWTRRISSRRRLRNRRWLFASPSTPVIDVFDSLKELVSAIGVRNHSIACCRCARLRRGSSLHPGTVRSQEQIDDQRDLLSHDVRHRHHQHPVRLRCRHWRHHRQQPARLRSLLKQSSTPSLYLSLSLSLRFLRKWPILRWMLPLFLALYLSSHWSVALLSAATPPPSLPLPPLLLL